MRLAEAGDYSFLSKKMLFLLLPLDGFHFPSDHQLQEEGKPEVAAKSAVVIVGVQEAAVGRCGRGEVVDRNKVKATWIHRFPNGR